MTITYSGPRPIEFGPGKKKPPFWFEIVAGAVLLVMVPVMIAMELWKGKSR